MSLKSWKKEFYPVGASTVARDKTKTDLDLIDHCINKWEGGLSEALVKHDVTYTCRGVNDPKLPPGDRKSTFWFSSSNCALCQRYDRIDSNGKCEKCPLAQSRGGVKCYIGMDPQVRNVYGESKSSPVPMIEALHDCRQWILNGRPPVDSIDYSEWED